MDLSNKKILVTGGGAGIGKSLIEECIQRGARHFAITGRTAEKLDAVEEEFSSANFLKIPGDVSKQSDIEKTVKNITEEWGELDILVNNAGVVSAGRLTEISDEDIINQININLTGLVLMTKYALPLLKESIDGAIINISSGLGYIAMPFYSVYAATKAGVKHFSEAMRRELDDYPLHVMTVYPTATDTDMMKTADVKSSMDSPELVAQATLDGLMDKEIEVILGGQRRLDHIHINVNEPLKIDNMLKDKFDSLASRAEKHRAM